jgi:serine/threonine-protein kinase
MKDRCMLEQTICGRYKLIRELAKGGFGTTFLAEDILRPGNPYCVVKQLTPRFHDDDNLKLAKRLFEEEAKVLQKLGNFEYIPRLEAYFEENDQFYLVQEFIEGHNLIEELNRAWTEAETIELLLELLKILVFIQQNNYIHRDITPKNIIRRSSDRRLTLIDFGAVKEKVSTQIIAADGSSSFTVCIGSPGYMPLEQADGKPKFASDLYAVGKIAIQALTGISPRLLLEDGDGELLWRDRLQPNTNYTPQLLDFLDKMVRLRFQERYSSAAEALDALQKIIASTNTDTNNNHKKTVVFSFLKAKTRKHKISKSLLLNTLRGAAVVGLLGFFLSNIFFREKFLVYKNPRYGIKIDYPANWKLEEINIFFEKGAVFHSPLQNNSDRFHEKVSVLVKDVPSSSISLAEYTDLSIQDIKASSKMSSLETQKTSLANHKAMKVIYSYQEGKNEMERMKIWTLTNQRAYVITYTAEKQYYRQFLHTAEDMIESFEIEQ